MIKQTIFLAVLMTASLTETSSVEKQIQYFDFPNGGNLTQDMKTYYDENGFLILAATIEMRGVLGAQF